MESDSVDSFPVGKQWTYEPEYDGFRCLAFRDGETLRERKPTPVKPVLVVEDGADHITSDYIRHGAKLLRWRDDKAPWDCTIEQLK